MARKTAMGKEPGNVSIALPQSEKDRLRGGGRRMPGKPRPMDDKGNFTDKQSLDRVSPGVYRNSQGKLVGSKGQALPKPSPIQNALQGAAQSANQQGGMLAGMEGGRMPAGRPGQQMSQQEVDAGMQAQNLANSFMEQYPSQIQSGYLRAPQGQAPMQMQDFRYGSPQGQQGQIQDLMYRYPPGQAPNIQALFNYGQRQQEQQQQPNSVSGLLQRRFK
jgi:hypothetical protein